LGIKGGIYSLKLNKSKFCCSEEEIEKLIIGFSMLRKEGVI
jgi:hypothetical protein